MTTSVHVQGATAATEARGELRAEAQKLGTVAKRVRGWPEELVAEWIEEWLRLWHEFHLEAEETGAARFEFSRCK